MISISHCNLFPLNLVLFLNSAVRFELKNGDAMRIFPMLVVTVAMLLSPSSAEAQRPVSGMPVPVLYMMDDMVQAYMDSFELDSAVVGFSFRGRIIYLRGFGWEDENLEIPLQENATFRVASITKTFTAAIIRDLVDRGMLGLNDIAFDVGQSGGGILDLPPFPAMIDPRIGDITVWYLLQHTAGWDRNLAPDLTGDDLLIQAEMGLSQLATREEMMRWILGHDLQHDQGAENNYSNEGYHALGLIAEQVSGIDLLTYVRTYLLKDELWFPAEDIFMGRSFAADQDPREPYYNYPYYVTNVFDPDGPEVYAPYGGWNHEVKESYGSIVSSGIPLLHQANNFQLNGTDRGLPLDEFHGTYNHGGAQRGNNSLLQQRSDGIDYIIMTNRYDTVEMIHARRIGFRINKLLLQYYIPWPYETVDCTWFDLNYSGAEEGTYNLPFGAVNDLDNINPFTKVKFKPGSTSWTGVLNQDHIAISAQGGGSMIFGQ